MFKEGCDWEKLVPKRSRKHILKKFGAVAAKSDPPAFEATLRDLSSACCTCLYCFCAFATGDLASNERSYCQYLEYLLSVRNSSPHTFRTTEGTRPVSCISFRRLGPPPALTAVAHPISANSSLIARPGSREKFIARKLAALRSFFNTASARAI